MQQRDLYVLGPGGRGDFIFVAWSFRDLPKSGSRSTMFLLYFQLFGSDKQCLIVAENGNSRLQISARGVNLALKRFP